MERLSEQIKQNEGRIRSALHIGYAIWDDLVTRVERQESYPKPDFYDEQIWTFLIGCAYALDSTGPDLLALNLIGAESPVESPRIWFESLPNSPRLKEGNSRVDLALGAIKLRPGTQSGIEFDRASGDWIAFCECKWYSDIDTKVSYDQHRNQLVRVIENALSFQSVGTFPKRTHVVLVTPASFKQRSLKSRLYQYKYEEYASDPQAILGDLEGCHLQRVSSYPSNLNELLGSMKLHWATYQGLFELAPQSAIQESLNAFTRNSDRSFDHC